MASGGYAVVVALEGGAYGVATFEATNILLAMDDISGAPSGSTVLDDLIGKDATFVIKTVAGLGERVKG